MLTECTATGPTIHGDHYAHSDSPEPCGACHGLGYVWEPED